ncbi:hypothetical protein AB1Y20_017686 [Prymnesium parvum]|uniref:Fe2OG dioxygenase domain-containing protein n=1 Tax=Prymnesium parvum TaxID=97485 RepID=A0AB34JLB1_PRYPA
MDVAEQLRPLSTATLQRRTARLEQAGPPHNDPRQPVSKDEALSAAVRAYLSHPREERRLSGVPLPSWLCEQLLAELRTLHWPPCSHRPALDSEAYLILTIKKGGTLTSGFGTQHPLHRLRLLCSDVLAVADPDFIPSAVAVTKNLVGSPHIDHFDRSYQLAVSLGDFKGGELCIDEESADPESSDVSPEQDAKPWHRVAVVETRNRVAKVDGRYVHWVRPHSGGDRFSIIFYNTSADPAHPLGPAVHPLSIPVTRLEIWNSLSSSI